MKTGVLGYGVYIPRERIQSELVLEEREKRNSRLDDLVSRLKYGLLVKNKALASLHEDAATMAYEATSNALRMSRVDPKDIGMIIFGSESKPYAVKTSATQVGSWVGCGKRKYAFDVECACNAGIQSIATVKAHVSSGSIDFGIGIGADVSSAAPRDDLEYAVGAGAVSGVVGRGTEDELVGELYPGAPHSSDYADFFRREGEEYPKHFGSTTADAYIEHVCGATIGVLEKYPEMRLKDFIIAPHEPNGYMPRKAFRAFVKEEIEKLKSRPVEKLSLPDKALLKVHEYLEDADLLDRAELTKEDIENKIPINVVQDIGNTYAAQTGIVLSDILDRAEPYQNILVVSYGSGAQAIAAPFMTLPGLEEKRGIVPTVQDYIDRMVDIQIDGYKKLFKERMKRWTAKHLVSRKLIGEIEPAEDSSGFYEISICKDCDAIYTPSRRCLDPDHDPAEVVYLNLPKKAVLNDFYAHSLRKSLTERAGDVMLQNKVILADCSKDELYRGMELEPVIRRLDHEGKEGLIHYSWAYRPLFRNADKYVSRLTQRAASEKLETSPALH